MWSERLGRVAEPEARIVPDDLAGMQVGGRADACRADLDLLRERVLNVVGHALHTPMSTARGYAEALHADPSLAADPEFRDGLLRAARTLERLLDHALIASDIDTRIPARTPQVLDLHREVTQRAAAVAPDAQLTATGPAVLTAAFAPSVLRRVLDALLEDARDYGDGRISVHTARDGATASLTIVTHGAPTQPEDLVLAFEPLFRGHDAVMRRTSGLGLGLPVARRLTERAGGSLSLRSGEGADSVAAVLEVPAA